MAALRNITDQGKFISSPQAMPDAKPATPDVVDFSGAGAQTMGKLSEAADSVFKSIKESQLQKYRTEVAARSQMYSQRFAELQGENASIEELNKTRSDFDNDIGNLRTKTLTGGYSYDAANAIDDSGKQTTYGNLYAHAAKQYEFVVDKREQADIEVSHNEYAATPVERGADGKVIVDSLSDGEQTDPNERWKVGPSNKRRMYEKYLARAVRLGLPEEAAREFVRKGVEAAVLQRVETTASSDPALAFDYLVAEKDYIDADSYAKAYRTLQPAAEHSKNLQVIDAAGGVGPTTTLASIEAAGKAAGFNPARMESLKKDFLDIQQQNNAIEANKKTAATGSFIQLLDSKGGKKITRAEYNKLYRENQPMFQAADEGQIRQYVDFLRRDDMVTNAAVMDNAANKRAQQRLWKETLGLSAPGAMPLIEKFREEMGKETVDEKAIAELNKQAEGNTAVQEQLNLIANARANGKMADAAAQSQKAISKEHSDAAKSAVQEILGGAGDVVRTAGMAPMKVGDSPNPALAGKTRGEVDSRLAADLERRLVQWQMLPEVKAAKIKKADLKAQAALELARMTRLVYSPVSKTKVYAFVAEQQAQAGEAIAQGLYVSPDSVMEGQDFGADTINVVNRIRLLTGYPELAGAAWSDGDLAGNWERSGKRDFGEYAVGNILASVLSGSREALTFWHNQIDGPDVPFEAGSLYRRVLNNGRHLIAGQGLPGGR